MIVIYGIKTKLDPIKVELSNTLHNCMMEVLGLPEGKRAHRFIGLSADDFYYPSDRSDAYTVIEINMMEGRSVETKKLLIKTIFKKLEDRLSLSPIDVEITIKEQPSHCWGFRGMTGDEVTDLSYKVNK
jgi:phenylpyruvate tautomerase PptA (4-oxalocrotonate tautomerase family)